MLNVVPEIYAPPTLFDRDVNIKSTITGERLTSQQYLKEFYHGIKSKAKKMLETKKSKEIDHVSSIINYKICHTSNYVYPAFLIAIKKPIK